jgi:hypothetical protein
MDKKEIIRKLVFSVWLYSTLGGMYIVVNSWVHPESLSWPLTHHFIWPREDNFGMFSWIVSFFSFIVWQLLRKN